MTIAITTKEQTLLQGESDSISARQILDAASLPSGTLPITLRLTPIPQGRKGVCRALYPFLLAMPRKLFFNGETARKNEKALESLRRSMLAIRNSGRSKEDLPETFSIIVHEPDWNLRGQIALWIVYIGSRAEHESSLGIHRAWYAAFSCSPLDLSEKGWMVLSLSAKPHKPSFIREALEESDARLVIAARKKIGYHSGVLQPGKGGGRPRISSEQKQQRLTMIRERRRLDYHLQRAEKLHEALS